MHRKALIQRIGLFLFLIVAEGAENQRKCISNICFNGGTCVVEERGNDEAPVFECLCVDGFTGTLCEEALHCNLDCQNGGECRYKNQRPFCSCKQGFGGDLCRERVGCQQSGCPKGEICLFDLTEQEFKCKENKCTTNPCKNNATCRALPGDYLCECPRGLRGKNCQEDVDECAEEDPCLNNGECKNLIGDFSCKCQPGFSGKICEQRSGFCIQKPCGSHGTCEDLGDNFRCICDEGFSGPTCNRMKPTMSCEKPRVLVETEDGTSKCLLCNDGKCENSIEDCVVDGIGCMNGGACMKDGEGKTFCKCGAEFSGRWCENQSHAVDKEFSNENDTCTPNPCQNNGVCSNEDGYAKCACLETHTGRYCQLRCSCPSDTVCRENLLKKGHVECLRNISSCDDCFNVAKCIYADKRLMCLCSAGFSGPVCYERTNPCSTMKCSDNQVCRLRRTSFGDTPYCSCPEGTFGFKCQRKLPPATFGPNSVAVIQAPTYSENREEEFSLEFTFRTTVPNVHLVSGENILNELDFSLELVDGYLSLQLGDYTLTDLLELRLNDADWYTVVFGSSKDMELIFEVHDVETGYVLAHKPLGHHQFNVFTVRFGRRKQNTFFTGCLREIRINRMPIDVFARDRSVDVLQGCQFQPQCKADSCGHGTCVELWNSYRCECRRPYLLPNCLNEVQEATFGKDNQTSILAMSIQSEVSNSLVSNTEFSFLVRTNKPDGQIFYVGQSGEDDTSTFISCGVRNGTVSLDSRLGGKHIHQLRGRRKVDDNIQHLVEVKRHDNNFTLYLDGSKEGQILIAHPFAHPLIADKIVLGGEDLLMEFNQSEKALFKGTLQDVRINEKNLVLSESLPSFLKLNQSVGVQMLRQNLLMGTVSDDLCAKKPCVHGSCTNTFNDFVCSCEKGYMGKDCGLVDFCSGSPCSVETAQCLNTHGGYICKAPATFAKTSQAKFVLKQPKNPIRTEEQLLKFSFAIRTRTTTSQIFKINTPSESLSMDLRDGNVFFRYTNQNGTTEDPLSVDISNGQWHSIEVFEQRGDQLLATFDNSTVPLLNPFSLIDFLNGNDSWLTFGRSQNYTGFKGCLHNVRLGDLPELSFFSLADSGTFSLNGTRHFESRSLQNIRSDGCHSKDLCGPVNYCRNGALCRDLFNLRKCDCAPGFTGDVCEINVDECANNKDCGQNGQCIDGTNSFSCQCRPGFSGPLCITELDQCVKNPCNHGSCRTEDGRAVCSCSDDFTGRHCTVKRSSKCENKPCSDNTTLSCTDTGNGPRCECKMGFHGDFCEESVAEEVCSSMPCQHGGTCLPHANGTIECACPSNYGGQFCQNLRNNCKKGACGHGKCHSVFGGYMCECDQGWDGPSCSSDVNECLDEFPCSNNGTCINTNGGYECKCPKFYLGKDCEIVGVCARSPCKNSAECIQKSVTEYRCVCPEGYTGRNCETEIDYCLDEPCQNGASCQRIVGSYICHCIAGFTGKQCEQDIDDCADNEACQHGGHCLDRVNGFECNCLGTGWQGSRCEVDVNECEQPDQCQNGECRNLPGNYSCSCQEGHIGRSCSMKDPCVLDSSNRTLHNCIHGNCVNPRVVQQSNGRSVTEYDCRCYDNYSGQFCTHVEQTRRPISIGYILGPGVALLIVFIVLVCMLFFFVAKNRRANQGTYSPSTHEMNGAARVQMHTLQTPLKKQERLI